MPCRPCRPRNGVQADRHLRRRDQMPNEGSEAYDEATELAYIDVAELAND